MFRGRAKIRDNSRGTSGTSFKSKNRSTDTSKLPKDFFTFLGSIFRFHSADQFPTCLNATFANCYHLCPFMFVKYFSVNIVEGVPINRRCLSYSTRKTFVAKILRETIR